VARLDFMGKDLSGQGGVLECDLDMSYPIWLTLHLVIILIVCLYMESLFSKSHLIIIPFLDSHCSFLLFFPIGLSLLFFPYCSFPIVPSPCSHFIVLHCI